MESSRRQVDGDPAGREDGGPDAVTRLSHGRVRQAHDGEAGEPVGDVDLDRDSAAHGTVQRGGAGGGDEHHGERSHQWRLRSFCASARERLAAWFRGGSEHRVGVIPTGYPASGP